MLLKKIQPQNSINHHILQDCKGPFELSTPIDTGACTHPLTDNGVPFTPTSFFPVHCCKTMWVSVLLISFQAFAFSSETAAPACVHQKSKGVRTNHSKHAKTNSARDTQGGYSYYTFLGLLHITSPLWLAHAMKGLEFP